MSAEKIELDPSWRGLAQQGPKKVVPKTLYDYADRIEQELTLLAGEDADGTPDRLDKRAEVKGELGADAFDTATAAKNSFNQARVNVVGIYREMLTQLKNSATTARATAKHADGTDKDAAANLNSKMPDGSAPTSPTPPANPDAWKAS